jgi:hypothetical protein
MEHAGLIVMLVSHPPILAPLVPVPVPRLWPIPVLTRVSHPQYLSQPGLAVHSVRVSVSIKWRELETGMEVISLGGREDRYLSWRRRSTSTCIEVKPARSRRCL